MTLTNSDVVEVAALVAKYNRAFDQDKVDDWVETFTPDGVFISKDGTTATGHDGLREWFLGREHITIHVTTDPTLEEDEGIVRHRCTILVFRRRGEGYVLGSVGEYDDALRKTEAGWRFSKRTPVTHPVLPSDP
ncbi:MAG: nuclear transport factor 2 family protein [Acidimicrobiales bacterium]